MRKLLPILAFLIAAIAPAQTYTTITATNVLVDNGSGTAVHPPAGSSLCFLGVNNLGAAITYTPSGGSPVSGTVCQTLTSGGALTGTLQVANAATASPVGLYYTITVVNGGTTYLTIPIISVSGTLFNYDTFGLQGSQQAVGIGFAHLTCSYGARWTSTTLPAGEAGQICNTSGQWQGYPPNPYCPAGQAYAVPQSGGQPMCQSPTLEGIGNPAGFCTEKSTYLDIGTGSSNFWACRNGTWTLFSSTSPGVTSINGAAGSFTFTGAGVSCTSTTCTFNAGTTLPSTNQLLAGNGSGGAVATALDDGQTNAGIVTSTEPIYAIPASPNIDIPPVLGQNNATSTTHITSGLLTCPNITTSTVQGCEFGVGAVGNSMDGLRAIFEYHYGGSAAANFGALAMTNPFTPHVQALKWDYLGNVYLPQKANLGCLGTDVNGNIGAGTGCTSPGGTVTSVGLSLPAIFSVTGTPVTSSGVLTATFVNQAANQFFAGPSTGSPAAPSFRAIASSDLPLGSSSTPGALQCGSGTTCSGGLLSVSASGGSPGTPAGTLQAYKTSSAFAGTSEWVFEAGVNGAACDDTTDDTAAFNTLLGTVNTAHGGTIQVYGTCLISGQITIPNNGGGPPPFHYPIRITGALDSTQFAAQAGGFTMATSSPSTLDMRFNATTAKIVDFGLGQLEIDHIVLEDGGSDCARFLYTTNPVISVHDVLFSGTASGVSACNDAIRTGGTTTSVTGDATGTFYGYGSKIQHNEFDKIRTAWYATSNTNAVPFKDNIIDFSSGGDATHCAVTLDGSVGSARGNIFSGNFYETSHYPYTVCANGSAANFNMWFGDTLWDASSTTTFQFHFTNSPTYNIANVAQDTVSTKLTDGLNSNNVVQNQQAQEAAASAATRFQPCTFTSGSGTAQVCDTSGFVTPEFTPFSTSTIFLSTGTANTGASFTLNVNGFGAVAVAKISAGTKTTTLAAGDVISGFNPMYYDGTNWVLISPGSSQTGLSGMTSGQVAIAGSATTVTSSKVLAGSGTGVTTGPTSVTAGNCAQFTGTTGQIADAGSPCGSGSSGAMTNLGASVTWTGCTYSGGVCTTTGSVASIDIASIPSTSNQLYIVIQGAGASAGTTVINCQFSGDTASDYAQQNINANGSTAGGNSTTAGSSVPCGVIGNSTFSGLTEMTIPFYSISQAYHFGESKVTQVSGALSGANITQYALGFVWNKSASTISEVKLIGGNNIASGAVVSIYGIN